MRMVTREALLEASRRVIKDAVVENGAIVAANTDMKYYPRDVTSYRYVCGSGMLLSSVWLRTYWD